jgi:tetratricopeptide (TPR) repeat protein
MSPVQPAFYPRATCLGIVAGILAITAPCAAQDVNQLMSQCAGKHGETDDEMITACTTLVALPQLDTRQRSLAYSYRASGYQLKNELDRALADANEAIKVDASSSRAFYRRGDIYKNLHQNELALQDFNEAIRLDPKVPVYFVDRSNSYVNLKQFDLAIRDLDEALRLDPKDDINAISNRCNVFTLKGEFDAALSDCQKGMQMHPGEAYPLSQLGFLYYKWGKLDDSIASYDAALAAPDLASYDPYDRAYPLYGRGLARVKKGDKAGGDADMATAVAIAKDIAFEFE